MPPIVVLVDVVLVDAALVEGMGLPQLLQ